MDKKRGGRGGGQQMWIKKILIVNIINFGRCGWGGGVSKSKMQRYAQITGSLKQLNQKSLPESVTITIPVHMLYTLKKKNMN